MALTFKDAKILIFLLDHDATDKIHAMTLKEIEKESDREFKVRNLYDHLVELISFGYVEHGLKYGSANTYYVTESGIVFIGNNYLQT